MRGIGGVHPQGNPVCIGESQASIASYDLVKSSVKIPLKVPLGDGFGSD